ncbi:chitinase 2-like [Typha latifolia]|uniref:chitinase 2-like n=1 Tax=Typha latifolia TaxID=4733 RepID=UPI003C301EA4
MASQKLFREYIGAGREHVRLSDVPIVENVDFHFILAFAIDYTKTPPHEPTDGIFDAFFFNEYITAKDVADFKDRHPKVKVALSLGGAEIPHGGTKTAVSFAPSSVDTWVNNAVASLTSVIKNYHIDGIDINYESFQTSTDMFAECIGRLITKLKTNGVISFASIAPYKWTNNFYKALWPRYEDFIDYVNYQFYAVDKNANEQTYLDDYNAERLTYGTKLLAGLASGTANAISPDVAIRACRTLHNEGKLLGIFIWSANNSRARRFTFEYQAQNILA